MARALNRFQQAELSAFVNRLAAMAGYTTTAEWARDSGYPPPNLSNLRNGRGGVDGYNLLRLIRAAAVRADADPGDLVVSAERAARPAHDITVQLDELKELLVEGLARLDREIADLGKEPAG